MTEDLNPQIKEIKIGVRSLRKLKIYPMSMADQKKFGEVFKQMVEEYLAQTPEGPMKNEDLLPFAGFVIKLIGENITEVLKIITDMRDQEIESFYSEITNNQLTELINTVYEENFGKPGKNLMGLFETAKEVFESLSLSARPLQQFSNDTANGISATSIPEDSETGG